MPTAKKSKSSTKSSPRPSIVKADPFLMLVFLIILVAFGLLGLKVVKYRMALGTTANSMMNQTQSAAQETAMLVSSTITSTNQGTPLYKQPKPLQAYITTASQQTKRDVVVVDLNKKILADTVVVNQTATFNEDKNNEVAATLKDGTSRTFTENSKDYPHGILQVVVALKDSANKTVGAVITSVDQVSK